MRIITVNLNGIRSADSKGFYEWLQTQQADVICLQEIRIMHEQLTEIMLNPGNLNSAFEFAEKRGYSGVGIYFRKSPDRIHIQVLEYISVKVRTEYKKASDGRIWTVRGDLFRQITGNLVLFRFIFLPAQVEKKGRTLSIKRWTILKNGCARLENRGESLSSAGTGILHTRKLTLRTGNPTRKIQDFCLLSVSG